MPPFLSGPVAAPPPGIGTLPAEPDEQFLLRAFSSFAEAAGSLEHSYGLLRAEVTQLRRELEESNSGLARSLEENRCMREHLDRILEGLPCGVMVVADEGEISRINPEGRRLLGLEEQTGAAAPSSVSSLQRELRQFLERARSQAGEQEQKFSCEGAEPRWLAARHARLPASAPGSSVFILRDVSEGKRLEEAQDKLRREQALAEMSAVLAHEIRNPLGSMELFAGLLADAQLTSECRQWVEHLQAGLRTLAATVNNVLHYHSLPELERVPIDLGRLLEGARAFLLPLARRSRVEISLQNRLAGVFFPADRHRLEQVLLNLVLNAVRSMPGGGWIKLAGRKLPQAISILVADTGPGITPDNMKNIFEPGFSTRAGSPGLWTRRVPQDRGTAWRKDRSRQCSRPGRNLHPHLSPG